MSPVKRRPFCPGEMSQTQIDYINHSWSRCQIPYGVTRTQWIISVNVWCAKYHSYMLHVYKFVRTLYTFFFKFVRPIHNHKCWCVKFFHICTSIVIGLLLPRDKVSNVNKIVNCTLHLIEKLFNIAQTSLPLPLCCNSIAEYGILIPPCLSSRFSIIWWKMSPPMVYSCQYVWYCGITWNKAEMAFASFCQSNKCIRSYGLFGDLTHCGSVLRRMTH